MLGEPVRRRTGAVWARVGYLVETPAAYPELTVRENLLLQARLHRVDRRRPRSTTSSSALALTPYADRRAGTLSLGNAQRLGLAKALLHRPELLVLDEPGNGLDPAGVVEIRELLRDLGVTRPALQPRPGRGRPAGRPGSASSTTAGCSRELDADALAADAPTLSVSTRDLRRGGRGPAAARATSRVGRRCGWCWTRPGRSTAPDDRRRRSWSRPATRRRGSSSSTRTSKRYFLRTGRRRRCVRPSSPSCSSCAAPGCRGSPSSAFTLAAVVVRRCSPSSRRTRTGPASLGLAGAKAQLAGVTADWPGYLALLGQTVAVGGFLIFGMTVIWIFGREFSDRTAKDLLALPTSRIAIVAAKFAVAAAWCGLLAVYAGAARPRRRRRAAPARLVGRRRGGRDSAGCWPRPALTDPAS